MNGAVTERSAASLSRWLRLTDFFGSAHSLPQVWVECRITVHSSNLTHSMERSATENATGFLRRHSLKLIALTAIFTTLSWATVVIVFFWWGSQSPSPSDRVHMQFLRENGTIGTVDMCNPKTQEVFIAIEQLPMGVSFTGRVQLSRQRLAAGGRVRIGVRELSEDQLKQNRSQ